MFAASLHADIFRLTARLPYTYQYTHAVVGGQGAAGATVSTLLNFVIFVVASRKIAVKKKKQQQQQPQHQRWLLGSLLAFPVRAMV